MRSPPCVDACSSTVASNPHVEMQPLTLLLPLLEVELAVVQVQELGQVRVQGAIIVEVLACCPSAALQPAHAHPCQRLCRRRSSRCSSQVEQR